MKFSHWLLQKVQLSGLSSNSGEISSPLRQSDVLLAIDGFEEAKRFYYQISVYYDTFWHMHLNKKYIKSVMKDTIEQFSSRRSA